jgi:regulator of replication initiation timing
MKEDQFISGIYNWCDRWCERCSYTSRCRVFEKEETRKKNNPDQDVWEAISDTFKETLELLQKNAEELGIDLEMVLEENETDKIESIKLDQNDSENPLTKWSDEYLHEGRAWLESDTTKDYLLQLQEFATLGAITQVEAENSVKDLEESLEAIQWYLFFIAVKIHRVLADGRDDFWKDYPIEERGNLGTAKIASIAIERSIGAWGMIYKLMPEDDRILRLLAKLDKMRKKLKIDIPDYPKFIRPGFDWK